mmetsp:Transcript_100613/g.324692  ORF Transcript_100613/g.324692 Transcript_100613/m.324692 type:complete len:404 (+) Transcript_100613:99-1310(+)
MGCKATLWHHDDGRGHRSRLRGCQLRQDCHEGVEKGLHGRDLQGLVGRVSTGDRRPEADGLLQGRALLQQNPTLKACMDRQDTRLTPSADLAKLAPSELQQRRRRLRRPTRIGRLALQGATGEVCHSLEPVPGRLQGTPDRRPGRQQHAHSVVRGPDDGDVVGGLHEALHSVRHLDDAMRQEADRRQKSRCITAREGLRGRGAFGLEDPLRRGAHLLLLQAELLAQSGSTLGDGSFYSRHVLRRHGHNHECLPRDRVVFVAAFQVHEDTSWRSRQCICGQGRNHDQSVATALMDVNATVSAHEPTDADFQQRIALCGDRVARCTQCQHRVATSRATDINTSELLRVQVQEARGRHNRSVEAVGTREASLLVDGEQGFDTGQHRLRPLFQDRHRCSNTNAIVCP